jgi:hypothetical protein
VGRKGLVGERHFCFCCGWRRSGGNLAPRVPGGKPPVRLGRAPTLPSLEAMQQMVQMEHPDARLRKAGRGGRHRTAVRTRPAARPSPPRQRSRPRRGPPRL